MNRHIANKMRISFCANMVLPVCTKKKISPVAMHRHTDILATGDMYTNSGVESIRYEQVRCLFRHGPMLGFLHFQEV